MAPGRDLVPRQVEAEDDPSFYICGRFGRVDVLARLILAHGPGSECEGLAALVADGDDEALSEKVGAVAAHEARLLRIGERPLLRPQVFGEPQARGGVAELEPARRLFAHIAVRKQAPPDLARGRRPQDVLVVLDRELEHREQAAARVGTLLLLRAQPLQLHPCPLRQHLEGAALVGLLDQLDECEDVAVPLAAEAVPGLHLGIDLETRAVLLVERAETPELLVALGEAEVLLDDLDQVDLGLDLGEGVVGLKRGHERSIRRSRD